MSQITENQQEITINPNFKLDDDDTVSVKKFFSDSTVFPDIAKHLTEESVDEAV